MKGAVFTLILILLVSLIAGAPTYPVPDTTIYDSISPPYILYIKGSPGICHYWFYDTDGTVQPLLEHQLNNRQFNFISIYEKQYRLIR